MSSNGQPPQDRELNNLVVKNILTVNREIMTPRLLAGDVITPVVSAENLLLQGGNDGDVLTTNGNGVTSWSPQVSFLSSSATATGVDTYTQIKNNKVTNFNLNNLVNLIATAGSFPAFPSGRTITFQNQSSVSLDLYLTVGYPTASGPTLLTTITTTSGPYVWTIPQVYGWNGNFAAYVSGTGPFQGATLAEFGLNQIWTGSSPLFRDTFDISTVPPGIGSSFPNGPRSSCVALSQQNGFSVQQSYGYNVGIQIVPSNSGSLPSQTVTCNTSNGDSVGSVTYPNDTAFPKQQTVQCLNNASYTVNFLNPTFS